MSARYMNPVTSRWASSDPTGWGLVNPNREGFSIVESINPYSFCGNNPINYIDPTGFIEEDPDGYVKFDDYSDTIHDDYEPAGYDSWEDAASSAGIRGCYNDDGEWKGGDSMSEGQALYGLIIEPSDSERDSYLAENYSTLYSAERYHEQAKRYW